VIVTEPTVDAAHFEARTGWAIKPQGACKGDVCVPLPENARARDGGLDVTVLAAALGMPVVRDDAHGVSALGPATHGTGRVLTTAVAPDVELPDANGDPFLLSNLRGQKVVLVSWATWCGCRFDLPLWKELRNRLHDKGVEIVTVALDVDADAARPYIEKANPSHPSLIDSAHVCDEHFGFVNVPNGVWIDEDGVIVRPAEQAHPGHNKFTQSFRTVDLDTLPPDIADMMREARKIRGNPELYVEMLDDWAEHGSDSRYALTPEEVVRRSEPRSDDEARAAAEFELGEWLHSHGDHEAAVAHWRNAHRLYPSNWTYKRQAWNFEDPERQGPTDVYDSCWLDDLKKIGAENYYPEIVP